MDEVAALKLHIKSLEDQLAFAHKQLEEKDKQVEHYKNLVKAMQDFMNKKSPPKEVKPPPGLEPKHLKAARKPHSFHIDPSAHHLDDDSVIEEMDPNQSGIVEDYEEYQKDLARRQQMETEYVARSPNTLKKSRSHTSLAHLSEERNSFGSPLRASTTSLPNLPSKASKSPSSPSVGLSPTGKDQADWKASKLKKSQSMTSVYSALEENRFDLKFPELDQIVGQIYQLSKYQQGCRFLQKKLEEDNQNASVILKELFDHLVELMTDPFGNYLFTKLVEHCDTQQKEKLLQTIIPQLNTVAFDMYGTQSMQKMMPMLTEDQVETVINALKPHALALIKHNKANYLIQYCLDRLSDKHKQWIYDAVGANIEDVSRDRVGCVIVKRCIDHANEEQMNALLQSVMQVSLSLVQDPFGNYVVQHILNKFPSKEQINKLIRTLLGSITELCTQKFSSNVVEKCLKVADDDTRLQILIEITETDMLPQLLNDRFANFVIQTSLDVAPTEQRAKLVKNILPHLGKHYSPYTKRLQKKILQV